MSTVHFLTIGYIPKDCDKERIICGDQSESGTMEVSLKIEENKITNVDTDQDFEGDPSDLGVKNTSS